MEKLLGLELGELVAGPLQDAVGEFQGAPPRGAASQEDCQELRIGQRLWSPSQKLLP